MRHLPLAALAGAAVLAPAAAETEVVTFTFPQNAGVALNYFQFGDQDRAGQYILETRIFVDYVAGPGVNAADFASRFAVPVIDPVGGTEAFIVNGSDLGWTGSGTFSFSDVTDAFNGQIRGGRFGWEIEGGGTLLEGSRIEFVVSTVPAPGAATALAAGGLCAARRRRR